MRPDGLLLFKECWAGFEAGQPCKSGCRQRSGGVWKLDLTMSDQRFSIVYMVREGLTEPSTLVLVELAGVAVDVVVLAWLCKRS